MADCKMMTRRRSREGGLSLPPGGGGYRQGGGCSTTTSPYHPPQQHHHYHHNLQQNQTHNRSKSYHYQQHQHHHHQPHQFQSGYPQQQQAYQSPSPPLAAYPFQPQSYSSGAILTARHHHNQELLAPASPTSSATPLPPPRPWLQIAHAKRKRTSFTVLNYNILCSRYATKTLYNYCPNWALEWSYRRKAILAELLHFAPDIISLQELETDQFYNFFLPQLQLMGYSGIFGAKSRARTMSENKRKGVDGCAIFYRTNKFRLVSEHLIEFSQVAIGIANKEVMEGGGNGCSEEMLNRVQTKDNIALAALLETKLDSEQSSGFHGMVAPKPRPLLVCTCHIHWDPNYCDVKLVQTMMLMQELNKISDNISLSLLEPSSQSSAVSRCSSTSSSSCSCSTSPSTAPSPATSTTSTSLDSNVNLLICGDFNSLPSSGVIQFMESGCISNHHPDFKGLSYESYMNNKTTACCCQHNFHLKSAYPPNSLPFTNYTLDFQGVIDYIFHSASGLRPLGFLGPLDSSWLVQHNVVGAPHPSIPSDHLPLLVELEMMLPLATTTTAI